MFLRLTDFRARKRCILAFHSCHKPGGPQRFAESIGWINGALGPDLWRLPRRLKRIRRPTTAPASLSNETMPRDRVL
jgi:hypothetical protein